jgi:hypothetical protein
VFAGATLLTGCSGKSKATSPTPPPPQQADAGVDAAKPDAAVVVPDHIQPKPYGAPPARRRIV